MEREDLTKHTLNLYSGDYLKIQELWPDIGAARVIRQIIRQFLEKLETTPAHIDIDLNVKL